MEEEDDDNIMDRSLLMITFDDQSDQKRWLQQSRLLSRVASFRFLLNLEVPLQAQILTARSTEAPSRSTTGYNGWRLDDLEMDEVEDVDVGSRSRLSDATS